VASPSPIPLCESEHIVQLQKELTWAKLKIRVLEERLRLERIKKYGPGSEKLSDAQLQSLELEPGVSDTEVQAESEPLPAPQKQPKKRQHPGRQELPAGLRPGQGGHRLRCQRELDVEPAQYFVVVTKRQRRACRHCEEGVVTAAPTPARIIDKSLANDRVVIDIVVAKYLPVLLIPVAAVIRRELLGGSYIQGDESPVDVESHDRRGTESSGISVQYSGGATNRAAHRVVASSVRSYLWFRALRHADQADALTAPIPTAAR
jgi:transposase